MTAICSLCNKPEVTKQDKYPPVCQDCFVWLESLNEDLANMEKDDPRLAELAQRIHELYPPIPYPKIDVGLVAGDMVVQAMQYRERMGLEPTAVVAVNTPILVWHRNIDIQRVVDSFDRFCKVTP
jgi:hypothetical protein